MSGALHDAPAVNLPAAHPIGPPFISPSSALPQTAGGPPIPKRRTEASKKADPLVVFLGFDHRCFFKHPLNWTFTGDID